MRALVLALSVAVVLGGGLPGTAEPGPAGQPAAARSRSGVVGYAPPVLPVRVVRPFVPPSSPYGPGHRGVDLATHAGEPVRAAADATVRFAGPVAGRGVVVLVHPDGITTEYEPVRPLVRTGAVLTRGAVIGRVAGIHGSCPPGGCLHWGARRAGVYFDPLNLLKPLGPVRLLPDQP